MHKAYKRYGRISGLPPSFPTPYEVAKRLTEDIISNPQRYKLRGKCIIKITSTHIDRILHLMGVPDNVDAKCVSGFKAFTFMYLDHLLEKNGFKLAYKIGGHESGRKNRRYYIMPQCPEPRAKG